MTDKEEIRLMFVGDINFGEYYTSFGHGPRTYIKNESPFTRVEATLRKADFVIGNLEAALTDQNFHPKEPESVVLRGEPEDAHLLASANFKVLQVANNHTVQHGAEGFDQTVSVLRNQNIVPVGLNGQPVSIIEVRGVRIGFLAASDVPDNTDKNQKKYQILNKQFINHAKEAVHEVDHLFILLHWGLEASTETMEYQNQIAREMREYGVRGVIGQHPHLFYEITCDKGFVFAPSLGNFVFDLAWDTRLISTGILELSISGNHVNTSVWPVKIEKNGCLPCITHKKIDVIKRLKLYDLGSSMSGEQFRKTRYFLRNFLKGNTKLKLKFFTRKLLPALKKI